ncbi:MAG: DUF4328 domain-containing protein [Sphingomonas sp.]|jgi:hypothetical protein|uniref:DUF4328 domain-containing protein n=1 Tax=Sphingomonas sp. TaxID=28214 RepID=UPI0035684C66
MEFRNLRTLTLVVAVMVMADALWTPVILLWAAALPVAFQTVIAPIASAVDTAALCFKIATMIVFARWIYVAGSNLVDADVMDLEFTPASRIWWFFVPIASLFKPFQGMRELWNASHGIYPGDVSSSLVATWWGLWLLANMVGYATGVIANPSGNNPAIIWVSCGVDIATAVTAIMMIRGIARSQEQLGGASLSEVFA